MGKMQQPIGPEIPIWDLVPGEQYYAFSNRSYARVAFPTTSRQIFRSVSIMRFRGTFTKYYVNVVGYNMLCFHNTHYVDPTGNVYYYGSPDEHTRGCYWRIFEPDQEQVFKFYRVSRLTPKQQKELATRVTLRERRQYERGLTGSTPSDLWFPRDLVREISLKYLTDPSVGRKPRGMVRC